MDLASYLKKYQEPINGLLITSLITMSKLNNRSTLVANLPHIKSFLCFITD